MKNRISYLVKNIFRLGGSHELNKAPTRVQLMQMDRGERSEIDRLERELAEMEFVLGERLVYSNMDGFKTRMTTLANRHLKTAEYKSEELWIAESKGYVRYCCRKNDRNAVAVMTMLMPFELRYREAQTKGRRWIKNAKPTVGQGGGN